MKKLLKFVKNLLWRLRGVKSIKPTYRITLNNLQSFTISDIGNNFGFGLAKISGKEYDILNVNQINLALDALNSLQTKPIMSPVGGESGEEDTETTPEEEPEEEPEA